MDKFRGESCAPTARLDTIILMAARVAYYNRIVSKLDIAGAYLSTASDLSYDETNLGFRRASACRGVV